MAMTGAERQRRWRQKNLDKAREQDKARDTGRTRKRYAEGNRPPAKIKRANFCGIDGEGWDVNGRHEYMMICAGEFTLYTGRPLGSWEILEWLSTLPKRTWIAFSFGYDVTMILRGLIAEGYVEQLKALTEADCTKWTEFGRFALKWTPKKSLSVKRVGFDGCTIIHDTFSFWQSSFVAALQKMRVCTDAEMRELEEWKGRRSGFTAADVKGIMAYCQKENLYHVRLMEALEERFISGGMSGYPWEGPGPVASKYMRRMLGNIASKHSAIGVGGKRYGSDEGPELAACKAYYGGWFETSAHGPVRSTVWQWDITSAYPHAMRTIPCMEHGRWRQADCTGRPDRRGELGELYIAEVQAWQEPCGVGGYYGLPFRRQDGTIHRPRVIVGDGGKWDAPASADECGGLWYWSHEIERVKGEVKFLNAWVYERHCDCRPFAWVEGAFEQRRIMEREEKGSGIGLKLVLNSLYGKTAQRIGNPPHHNYLYASYITSFTRGMMLDIVNRHQGDVVMIATDAVFVTCDLSGELAEGKSLGEWERTGPYDDLCIWAPGVYFDGDKALMKTRGLSKRLFKHMANELRAVSHDPTAKVDVFEMEGGRRQKPRYFYGLRMGLSQGEKHYGDIGEWLPLDRTLTADFARKRSVDSMRVINGTVRSEPYSVDYCPKFYEPLVKGVAGPAPRIVESRGHMDMLTEDEER